MTSMSAPTGSVKSPASESTVNMMRNFMSAAVNNLPQPVNPWDQDVQWIFTLHEATSKKIEEWLKTQKNEGRMTDKTVQNWLASPIDEFAVFSFRNLISTNVVYNPPSDGLYPWDRNHLFRQQKPPINDPANTYLFAQFLMAITSNEKILSLPETLACQKGIPHLPGYVHFADIVLYRLIERGMGLQGINSIKIITNPSLFAMTSMKANNAKRELKVELNYCANMECMVMGTSHARCAGCSVAFYCSKECQKADWKGKHKSECRKHQEMHKSIPNEAYFQAVLDRED